MSKWKRRQRITDVDPTLVVQWDKDLLWKKVHVKIVGGGYGVTAHVFIGNRKFFVSEAINTFFHPWIEMKYYDLEERRDRQLEAQWDGDAPTFKEVQEMERAAGWDPNP